jgi:hypothetical protein
MSMLDAELPPSDSESDSEDEIVAVPQQSLVQVGGTDATDVQSDLTPTKSLVSNYDFGGKSAVVEGGLSYTTHPRLFPASAPT